MVYYGSTFSVQSEFSAVTTSSASPEGDVSSAITSTNYESVPLTVTEPIQLGSAPNLQPAYREVSSVVGRNVTDELEQREGERAYLAGQLVKPDLVLELNMDGPIHTEVVAQTAAEAELALRVKDAEIQALGAIDRRNYFIPAPTIEPSVDDGPEEIEEPELCC